MNDNLLCSDVAMTAGHKLSVVTTHTHTLSLLFIVVCVALKVFRERTSE
jgi:hypothetical protein